MSRPMSSCYLHIMQPKTVQMTWWQRRMQKLFDLKPTELL